ncbi:hypothetical protein ACN28S_42355 [Cystobacter fuscus]
MQPEEFFQAVRERAESMSLPRAHEAREPLRVQALALFARIPEPPVYHRAEDPARKAAEALLPELEQVLALGLAVRRDAGPAEATDRLLEALRAHGEALCHTVDGRLSQAEEAWRRAVELERVAHPTRSLGTRDQAVGPVYDRSTGASRYDPRVEPVAQVWLACPNMGCKRINEYGYVPGPGIHAYVCSACRCPSGPTSASCARWRSKRSPAPSVSCSRWTRCGARAARASSSRRPVARSSRRRGATCWSSCTPRRASSRR